MAYFQCTGGSGKGNEIVVTCDSEFAGATITLTDGTKVKTKVCPSSSPYEIVFYGIEEGSWTVKGTANGVEYSYAFTVTDKGVTLAYGFNWRDWATAGGVDPDDYEDIDDLFDDEPTVRKLMLVHNSADYIISETQTSIDALNQIIANETAMKWLGQCDYLCDALEEITGAVAKLLTSTYWERYLKDHVPKMTSTSAPYGSASASQPFDGNDSTTASGTSFYYRFTTPVCVKKFACSAEGGTLSGSIDGSTYDTIGNPESNTAVYFYYKVTFSASVTINFLQFYGRALTVSVPRMTANTTPYGTAGMSTGKWETTPWKAFEGTGTGNVVAFNSSSGAWCGYKFNNSTRVRMVCVGGRNDSYSSQILKNFDVMASNDNTTYDTLGNFTKPSASGVQYFVITNSTGYRWYRIVERSNYGSDVCSMPYLNFYGADYSEKEFEQGETRLWLYDHGVDLVNLNKAGSIVIGADKITLSAANDQGSKTIDLTSYDAIRAKIGDSFSGTTQLIAASTATSSLNTTDAPFANGLNIASVNQSLESGVKMTAAGLCEITELWLEKA